MSGYCTLGIDRVKVNEFITIPGIYDKVNAAYDSGKPILDTTLVEIDGNTFVAYHLNIFKEDGYIAIIMSLGALFPAVTITPDDRLIAIIQEQ